MVNFASLLVAKLLADETVSVTIHLNIDPLSALDVL
jgi:hypothetical protein